MDSALVTSAMFYLALLALHLFCRAPNPPSLSANLRTLKLYGLECGVVPIQVRPRWTDSSCPHPLPRRPGGSPR